MILAIFLLISFFYLQFGGGGMPAVGAFASEVTAVPESEPASEVTAAPESEPASEVTAAPESEPVSEVTAAPASLEENPYKEYFEQNKDMAGWLQIPDTNIDYPVMWTPGQEEYYLRRGFDGSYDKAGCLILDTDSSLAPATTNLIIHGHNMKAGTMFGQLEKYEEEEYGASHSRIYLYTPETLRTYELIAVFRSQVYKKSDEVFKFYKFFDAASEEEFLDFYENIKKMSLYDTGVSAQYGDRFITLSTCSYHVERGRFVVVAREVSEETLYCEPEWESVSSWF